MGLPGPSKPAALVILLLSSGWLGSPSVGLVAGGEGEPVSETRGLEPFLLDASRGRELSPAEARDPLPRFRFPKGERLVYSVSYLGIPIGRIRIEVARLIALKGRRLAHVVAIAGTNAAFSKLYPIHDRSEAWIDIDTMQSVQSATRTRHGRGREVYEEVAFDWKAHYVHILEDKRHKSRVRELTLEMGPDVYDTFDVVYAIRALPLALGYSAQFPVYASAKIYGLQVDVNREETIENALFGSVKAWVLRPRNVLDGEPQGDGAGEIFVAATGRHVPLRVSGWFRTNTAFHVGSVRAELVEYIEGDHGWDAGPPISLESRVRPGPSVNGRPSWNAPDEVRAVREQAGLGLEDRKHRETSLEDLAACTELQSFPRFLVPPRPGQDAPQC